MSLDWKVIAQNVLVTTAKINCQSCTFQLFFDGEGRGQIFSFMCQFCSVIHLIPLQPLVPWSSLLLGLIAVSAFQPQRPVVVGISLSTLTCEAVSFWRSLMFRDQELGAPLATPATFPQSLCRSWWVMHVPEHREELFHPLWKDHTKKIPESGNIRNQKTILTQGKPFQHLQRWSNKKIKI